MSTATHTQHVPRNNSSHLGSRVFRLSETAGSLRHYRPTLDAGSSRPYGRRRCSGRAASAGCSICLHPTGWWAPRRPAARDAGSARTRAISKALCAVAPPRSGSDRAAC